MAKKKTDMSVFDRMLSGNDQLPGQTDIADFIESSEVKKEAATEKPKKKSFCFRADPDQIRRWKIFAAEAGITVEQLCVTAIEDHIKRIVSK